MLDKGLKAVKLLISGRVQGVCFRHWTVQTATAHSLDGWVRNLSDGNVEALLVGEDKQVEAVILKCKSGPSSAKVDHIEITSAIGITPKGFSQKPTLDINERRGQ
ncbi:MAG: acylphosphatase [Kordiimonadaceae bacterium]|jgi:acylphosphatase|nr:acylphosphatase [Kordiimonadaceae bacterium]MBT6033260.1 acylphosphatase [Kordiimonadaceae bacterium]